MEDLAKKVKIETVTSSSDIRPELLDSTCSQYEHQLSRFNETTTEHEIETKIYIKEERWWSEREDSCINDEIKGEAHEDFYSTKPPRFSKGVSCYTLDLFSNEDSGNNRNFNVTRDSPERESVNKCQDQDSVVIDISTLESDVCSERYNEGNSFNATSASKQGNLLQKSNTNKQDINEYQNSYECVVSEQCLKYPSHLGKHISVLYDKEANKCDIRDVCFNQLSPPRTHKLIDDAKRTHMCDICNKVFTQSSSLKIHKLTHEGIKPHKCNICNKVFTVLSHLKEHKLIHDGIKPHKCSICNKAFTQVSHLKRHKLIHEGIKPHTCNICSKTFTQLSHLKSHKLIHEGIKPHKCNVCNKAFTALSDLKKHKLIHEGIKPYNCNICNKGFTQISHLKRHKLSYHVWKNIHEGVCNKAFTALSNLKKKFIHAGINPHI